MARRLVTRRRRGRDRAYRDADQAIRRDYGARGTQHFYVRTPPHETSSMKFGTSPRSVPGAGARSTPREPTAPLLSAAPRDARPILEGLISPVASPTDALTAPDEARQYRLYGPGSRHTQMDEVHIYDPQQPFRYFTVRIDGTVMDDDGRRRRTPDARPRQRSYGMSSAS